MSEILDTKYQPANLEEVAAKINNLIDAQKTDETANFNERVRHRKILRRDVLITFDFFSKSDFYQSLKSLFN